MQKLTNITKCISPREFIDRSRPYHLTIADVLKLTPQIPARLFLMDEHIYDLTQYSETSNSVKPSQFFQYGKYADFMRERNLLGYWIWVLHGNRVGIDMNIEFHVDISGRWRPLRNGHVENGDGRFKYSGHHWSLLPQDTRVGWRGPAMFAKDMDKCPEIFAN